MHSCIIIRTYSCNNGVGMLFDVAYVTPYAAVVEIRMYVQYITFHLLLRQMAIPIPCTCIYQCFSQKPKVCGGSRGGGTYI